MQPGASGLGVESVALVAEVVGATTAGEAARLGTALGEAPSPAPVGPGTGAPEAGKATGGGAGGGSLCAAQLAVASASKQRAALKHRAIFGMLVFLRRSDSSADRAYYKTKSGDSQKDVMVGGSAQ